MRLVQVLGKLINNACKYRERHGGSVEARSEGIGKGSAFILRLPVFASES